MDAHHHHLVWNLTVMGNTKANHNSSEMKAVKGLYSTESTWWNSLFFPLETVLKIHQSEVSGNRPTSCPGRSKKAKACYCILVDVPTAPNHIPSLSTSKTNPTLPDANNQGRIHQSIPAAGSCPSLTPAPEQGWTNKGMGGLKGQGKGSLGPVYWSTNGNSDLHGASDW